MLKDSGFDTDQDFDPESETAQSGKAVAEAVSDKPTLYSGSELSRDMIIDPNVQHIAMTRSSNDLDSVFWKAKLGDIYINSRENIAFICTKQYTTSTPGTTEWINTTQWAILELPFVDQEYSCNSPYAQSGKAIAQALSRVKKIVFELAEDTIMQQLQIIIGNFTNNTIDTKMSFYNPRLTCNGVDVCNPMTAKHYYVSSGSTDVLRTGVWNKKGTATVVERSDGYLMFKDDITHKGWARVEYFKDDIILKAGIYELSIEYFGDIEQLPTMIVNHNGKTISSDDLTITKTKYYKFRDEVVEFALGKGHIYLFSVKNEDTNTVTIVDQERTPVTGIANNQMTGLRNGIIVCADRCTCMGLTGDFSLLNFSSFKNDKWDWNKAPYYITTTGNDGIDIWKLI